MEVGNKGEENMNLHKLPARFVTLCAMVLVVDGLFVTDGWSECAATYAARPVSGCSGSLTSLRNGCGDRAVNVTIDTCTDSRFGHNCDPRVVHLAPGEEKVLGCGAPIGTTDRTSWAVTGEQKAPN